MSDYSNMSLEELEFSLPMTIQREENKVMLCLHCSHQFIDTVTYEQHIWRSDDYFMGTKKRTYEISFREKHSLQRILFKTDRYHSFREALIEAHEELNEIRGKA